MLLVLGFQLQILLPLQQTASMRLASQWVLTLHFKLCHFLVKFLADTKFDLDQQKTVLNQRLHLSHIQIRVSVDQGPSKTISFKKRPSSAKLVAFLTAFKQNSCSG